MPHLDTKNGERLLMIVDEHWIKYVFPAFVYISLTGVSLFLFSLAGYNAFHSPWISWTLFIVALGLLLVVHHWFFFRLLSEAVDCIIITNQRSIQFETTLLLHDVMRENSFDKMRTVEAYKEGLLQNVLNYGTVRFQGGTDIALVPHPNSVAKDIEQAMGRR
jgi:hypothetical protein